MSDPGYRELKADDGVLLATDEVRLADNYGYGKWVLATEYAPYGAGWGLIGQPLSTWLDGPMGKYRSARRKLLSPTWIPCSKRVPNVLELPVILRYPNGGFEIMTTVQQISTLHSVNPASWHHYDMPPLPPPSPKPQCVVDNDECVSRWIAMYRGAHDGDKTFSFFHSAWMEALRWERERLKKGAS